MSLSRLRELASQLIVDIDGTKRDLSAYCLLLGIRADTERVNDTSSWLFDSLAAIAKNADEFITLNNGPFGEQVEVAAASSIPPDFLPSACRYLACEVTKLLTSTSTATLPLHGLDEDYMWLCEQSPPPPFNPDFWNWMAKSKWKEIVPGIEKMQEFSKIFDNVLLIDIHVVNNRIRSEVALALTQNASLNAGEHPYKAFHAEFARAHPDVKYPQAEAAKAYWRTKLCKDERSKWIDGIRSSPVDVPEGFIRHFKYYLKHG